MTPARQVRGVFLFNGSVHIEKRKLHKLATQFPRITDAVLVKGAADVQARMVRRIRLVDFIDSGATINSVAIQERSLNHYVIGPSTNYAIYGELGTRYMTARPFATPALADVRPSVLRALKKAIEHP